jgi:hypothetical protein
MENGEWRMENGEWRMENGKKKGSLSLERDPSVFWGFELLVLSFELGRQPKTQK